MPAMNSRFSNIQMVGIATAIGFVFSFPVSLYLNSPETIINTTPIYYKEGSRDLTGTTNTVPEKMIIADLLNMRISLVGTSSLETLPIITKGRPGSYYETPVGEYEVGLKSRNHFSSLGEVYMPYSVQFYANFFIHGIPYHPNGVRVSSDYSGGCIRLSDADAKKVYDFVTPKMKILVIGRESDYTENKILNSISARDTLLTLVALESVNQEKLVNYQNQKVKIKDITAQVMNGDSEAQNIIYSQLGRDNIQKLMDKKASAIGIENITFENDIDRKILLAYIANHKTFLLKLL
jgi:hypothetical protein